MIIQEGSVYRSTKRADENIRKQKVAERFQLTKKGEQT
jgi:hypothetical protein